MSSVSVETRPELTRAHRGQRESGEDEREHAGLAEPLRVARLTGLTARTGGKRAVHDGAVERRRERVVQRDASRAPFAETGYQHPTVLHRSMLVWTIECRRPAACSCADSGALA